MKKKILSIFVFFFCVSLVFAQGKKIDFVEYDLPNGLHVILHQDNSTPIVAVSVLYHVGSKNEMSDRTGFAHFFEHLMFEGSPNIKRGEYFKIVESNGGVLNANTSFDRTYYYEILPSNQFELGLWLESERMLHLKIDSVGVETQRKVVKEERKQSYDNRPYGSLLEKTFSTAYKKHPYKWMPIGSAQYIDQAKLQEFLNFHKMYYVPNNATLSIAGDIKIADAKKLIAKYFGDIPARKEPIYRPNANKVAQRFKGKRILEVSEVKVPDIVEPKQEAENRDVVYDNVQLPAVIISYHIPEQGTEDFYAMQVLGSILSGGQSSRMNREVVDKQQKAMFAGSFAFGMEDPGLMLAFAIANKGVSVEELEKAMIAEIEKVQNEKISDNELQKAKNQYENSDASKRASVAGIAEQLANSFVYYGNTNLVNVELKNYLSVTKDDIQRVAKKYLSKENRTVLHYLPKTQQSK